MAVVLKEAVLEACWDFNYRDIIKNNWMIMEFPYLSVKKGGSVGKESNSNLFNKHLLSY